MPHTETWGRQSLWQVSEATSRFIFDMSWPSSRALRTRQTHTRHPRLVHARMRHAIRPHVRQVPGVHSTSPTVTGSPRHSAVTLLSVSYNLPTVYTGRGHTSGVWVGDSGGLTRARAVKSILIACKHRAYQHRLIQHGVLP